MMKIIKVLCMLYWAAICIGCFGFFYAGVGDQFGTFIFIVGIGAGIIFWKFLKEIRTT